MCWKPILLVIQHQYFKKGFNSSKCPGAHTQKQKQTQTHTDTHTDTHTNTHTQHTHVHIHTHFLGMWSYKTRDTRLKIITGWFIHSLSNWDCYICDYHCILYVVTSKLYIHYCTPTPWYALRFGVVLLWMYTSFIVSLLQNY